MKKWRSFVFIAIISCYFIGCSNLNEVNKDLEHIEETTPTPQVIINGEEEIVTIYPTAGAKVNEVKQDAVKQDESNDELIIPSPQVVIQDDSATEQEIEADINHDLIEQAVISWATAYSNKDGNSLYQLFDPNNKEGFFQIKDVNSSASDDIIDFGGPGAWPGSISYVYSIYENTAEVFYSITTPGPHIYVWIENLTLAEDNGLYYIVSEEMRKYDTITTKDELMASVQGNYRYDTNMINYNLNGLTYELNQNAIKDTAGNYSMLFSPETAAPYLLNLSGGTCGVKTQYEACTVVTYQFENGDIIDIQMSHPFGTDGIWMIDDIDVEYNEEYLQQYDDWYKKISLDDLKQIKEVASYEDLWDSDNDTPLLLAAIPEDDVYLYGLSSDGAVILRVKDKYQLFYWFYTTPQCVFPEIGYADYNDDGDKEVAVSLHTGTGTGYSVEQLYLVEVNGEDTMWAIEFLSNQYLQQIRDRVSVHYDEQSGLLQFYIDGDKAGNAIDISSTTKEANGYSGIYFGDVISFIISNEEIKIGFAPGCCFKAWGTPDYSGMPNLISNIVFKEGEFLLSDIELE